MQHISEHPLFASLNPLDAGAVLSQIAADVAATDGTICFEGDFTFDSKPFIIPQGCRIEASAGLVFRTKNNPIIFRVSGTKRTRSLTGMSYFGIESGIDEALILDGSKYVSLHNFYVANGSVVLRGKTPDGSIGQNRSSYGCTGNRLRDYRVLGADVGTKMEKGGSFCTRNVIDCQLAQGCGVALVLDKSNTNRISLNAARSVLPVSVKGSKYNRIECVIEGKETPEHIEFDAQSSKNTVFNYGNVSMSDPSGRNQIIGQQ